MVKLRKVAQTAAIIGIPVVMLLLFDWVLMHTRYDRHRNFLEHVTHYPSPDEVHINSDGVRGYREAAAFREEELNIIFLGDSFVWGFDLWPEEAVPQQFQQRIRRRFPDRKIKACWAVKKIY